MAGVNFQMKFSGDVKKFEKFLRAPKTLAILEKEVGRATARNAALLQDRIVENILTGSHAPNSPLTKALKGSSNPLIDTGEMMKAIEVNLKSAWTAHVGFLKNQKTSHGGSMRQIVPLLERGFTIKITPAMRAALFLKLKNAGVSTTGSTTAGTGVMNVPPRPFITPAFESKEMHAIICKNWQDAVNRTLRQVGAL